MSGTRTCYETIDLFFSENKRVLPPHDSSFELANNFNKFFVAKVDNVLESFHSLSNLFIQKSESTLILFLSDQSTTAMLSM